MFQSQVRVNHEVNSGISRVNSWRVVPRLIMLWKNAREVNPGVKVNLWLVNPQVNLSMERSVLSLIHTIMNRINVQTNVVQCFRLVTSRLYRQIPKTHCTYRAHSLRMSKGQGVEAKAKGTIFFVLELSSSCLLYTSPSPRD